MTFLYPSNVKQLKGPKSIDFIHRKSPSFLARDVIYTSCTYAVMPVSVCLTICLWRLCIVITVQWIPDIFACLDRWMSLLLTDNASPGSSDGMMPGFLMEVGGMENCNCSDITYFTYWESGPETRDTCICLYQRYLDIFVIVRVNSLENALYLKNGLC